MIMLKHLISNINSFNNICYGINKQLLRTDIQYPEQRSLTV